jgi:hypothetical protein
MLWCKNKMDEINAKPSYGEFQILICILRTVTLYFSVARNQHLMMLGEIILNPTSTYSQICLSAVGWC